MIKTQQKSFSLLGVILASFCLRIVITGVGSLLGMIQSDLSLSSGTAGILTTLPLLAFAVFSPLVDSMSHRWGEGMTLCIGLFAILMGTVMRSTMGLWGLFLGTAILGAGIAVGNVLIPAFIKAQYPTQVGTMTGIFTVAMSLASALSLGISVPMAEIPGFGWQKSLGIWAILVAVTLLVWWKRRTLRLGSMEQTTRKNLLRLPLTWQVTIFFGITSMMFYAMISWLPTIMQHSGMSSTEAGVVTSVFQLVGIPASLLAPIWAGKRRDQRLVIALSSILTIIGILTLIVARSSVVTIVAVVLLGISNGSNFSMGLALFGFRTSNAEDAARLSGIAQSIGYLLAATGPFAVGWIYDIVPNWSICLIYLFLFSLLALVMGLKAGADKTI